MKRLLLLGLPSAALAQSLPVPGARNPDWKLLSATPPLVPTVGTDRMPSPRGISGAGKHHYYWTADQQLRYEWDSRPGQTAPADSVAVHEDATGTVYLYRRRAALPAAPRQWRRLK